MTCTNPILITKWAPEEGGMRVPCGKCTACRIRRSAEWALRATHENEYHDHKCFIRLSYSDENRPENNEVKKDELQDFFKALRKRIGPGLRYMACGEYGENNEREHYHAAIWGYGRRHPINPKRTFQWDYMNKLWRVLRGPLTEAWKDKGYITLGTLTYGSARYIAGYLLKSNVGKRTKDKLHHDGRKESFFLVSKGIGKQWCLDHEQSLRRELVVRNGNTIMGMPRYYTNLLDIPRDEIAQKAKELKEEIRQYHLTQNHNPDRIYQWELQDKRNKVATKEARRQMNESTLQP